MNQAPGITVKIIDNNTVSSPADPIPGFFIRKDRYDALVAAEKLLHHISTCSPCINDAGSARERSCKLCLTFIDEARDHFGYQHYPQIPATKKV